MDQNMRLSQAMQEMCNSKVAVNKPERVWQVADIDRLLREERYDELDERFNQALTESFLSREAEKRYFFAWTHMCNPFSDMNALVEAGADGLALIKTWQRARPRSTHAWLAEAQYWNHRAWLYRSYGWARDTTRAMWLCAAACNEQMVIATLNALDCDPRQWLAAALTSSNSKVFGEPDWLEEFLLGADITGQPLMQDLADYHRHSPQEMATLMAYSGLSFDDAVCPPLPRPINLPDYGDHTGQQFWFAVCMRIFPRAYYALDEYIPFRMPRWRGSHEEIRELLASTVCDHLSFAEREHLELLIWWDDYRDLRIKDIDDPTEREHTIAKAKEIAEQAHNQEDRQNALSWLRLCYDDLGDKDALWHCLKLSVMEKAKLNNYFTSYTLKFALRDYPDSPWIANFLCQNSQQTDQGSTKIYRGFFQYAGLGGFEKDETQGLCWLDSVSDIKHSGDWRSTIRNLRWLQLPEYSVTLAELGAQRNIPGALRWFAVEYANRDDNTLLPWQPRIALEYYQREEAILLELIAQRDRVQYRLIDNGGYTDYEKELPDLCYGIAFQNKRLSEEESDPAQRTVYEKNLLDYLYRAHQYGNEQAWGLFLLNIFEVKDLALAHSWLDLVREEAEKGTLQAMVTLSRLHSNKNDKSLYNMKLSARWAHFAYTLYPESEIVVDCLYYQHFSHLWKRCRYAWYTFRIADTELPGQRNSMV